MKTSAARDQAYEYAPERAGRGAPVRVAKAKRGERQKNAFMRSLAAYTAVLAVLMAGTVYSRLVLSETRARINSRGAELTELESENAYLSYKLESLVSLKNAETYAVDTLGLVKLDSSRVEYVDLRGENVIEGSQDAKTLPETLRGWFDSVIDWLDG